MSKVLQNAPMGAFCNIFDLHLTSIGLENLFFGLLKIECPLKTGFTVLEPNYSERKACEHKTAPL